MRFSFVFCRGWNIGADSAVVGYERCGADFKLACRSLRAFVMLHISGTDRVVDMLRIVSFSELLLFYFFFCEPKKVRKKALTYAVLRTFNLRAALELLL